MICCGDCPVPCRMFSCIPGFCPRRMFSSSCDNQKCLRKFLDVPQGVKSLLLSFTVVNCFAIYHLLYPELEAPSQIPPSSTLLYSNQKSFCVNLPIDPNSDHLSFTHGQGTITLHSELQSPINWSPLFHSCSLPYGTSWCQNRNGVTSLSYFKYISVASCMKNKIPTPCHGLKDPSSFALPIPLFHLHLLWLLTRQQLHHLSCAHQGELACGFP